MNYPNKDSFEASKNDVFDITFDDKNTLACRIEEINTSNAPMVDDSSPQFSVIFSKPSPEIYEQGVYLVSHPKLGEFDIFLVPVFGDDEGVHYEAIFT